MYRNPNLACTKTLKWRQPNEKVTGSSITITFHSRWGKKTYLKTQKMFEISQTWSLHERVFEFIIHAKAKAWVFPTSFAVILSAVALSIVLKAEFNFELICTLPSFFLSPGSCFKSAICLQNSLESTPIALFSPRLREGKIIQKKSLRAPFTLIFHFEAT